MEKEIVINSVGPEIRVALLEDGVIVELFIERSDESNIAGNVYKGRIQRVLPGMQAAFVDIGLQQAAFIYVDDIINTRFIEDSEYNGLAAPVVEEENGIGQDAVEKSLPPAKPPIEELIAEGEEILVQIARSPIGSKGARLTTFISLPGRFLVLMPTVDHIGISRRITDENERARLKELVETLRTEPFGYIVRTAGEGVSEATMLQEMQFLTNLWADIQAQYKTAPAPYLLHQ